MKNIYFVGAQSTGKSTIAEYASREFKIPLIKEAARAIIEEENLNLTEIFKDVNKLAEFEQKIINRQNAYRKQYRDNNVRFISDRGFDYLAYCIEATRMDIEKLESEVNWDEYRENIVFFTRPIMEFVRDDGLRADANFVGINRIDSLIRYYLIKYKIPYFELSMKNTTDRIKLVESVLIKV